MRWAAQNQLAKIEFRAAIAARKEAHHPAFILGGDADLDCLDSTKFPDAAEDTSA